RVGLHQKVLLLHNYRLSIVILITIKTTELAYVNVIGINQITTTSGDHDDPLRTVEFALFHTVSSQNRASQIFIFPGNYSEYCLIIGGQSLLMVGTRIGSIEPDSQQIQDQLPGPSEIQNTQETDQDLIQVFNGVLTLHLLVIRIDNSYTITTPFSAIAIHGQQA
ncbi:MAG: hypothetical protein EZS28_054423, partial [Streblomastix strix]